VAYLRRVTDYLAASYGMSGIQCLVAGEPAYLNLDQAIPCGLIVNELVSNCYKHAFEGERGNIHVAISQQDNRLRIQVRDDGMGLPDDFKFSGTPSLGLQVVETLAVRQLHGTVEASRGPHATFTVEFELAADTAARSAAAR
jgi:two-component sensor histidine kinase